MQRYALKVDLAKLGDKRDEAMTHIQKSVKSASRSSLSASELGSEVGRNF
jgi:hypothetical protein